jgi:hydrogenase-4 component E
MSCSIMINLCVVLFGFCMLYMSLTTRIEAYIRMLSVQGLLLAAIVALSVGEIVPGSYWFLLFETVVIKTVIIPTFFLRITRKHKLYREVEPYLPNFDSLLVASGLLVLGYIVAYQSVEISQYIKPLRFAAAISTILVGLFIIMTRKKIITHVLGFMTMENGIFLLSLALAKEMPLIVDVGVFLDVFLGVFVFGAFLNRIQATYNESHDIDTLQLLKD